MALLLATLGLINHLIGVYTVTSSLTESSVKSITDGDPAGRLEKVIEPSCCQCARTRESDHRFKDKLSHFFLHEMQKVTQKSLWSLMQEL